ncbi:DUF6704 family protein [Zafaria sp. Z1313]|uniref:DUF6704 family protein n=1 Tax=unclassified Zafaria TaxID=2828765 RepID=UPI002E79E261|nr:DUF6704 family protein [Zafaria sp. J156]MEE1620157.1 DUF6704 family protein [Zafaria sp. J156]
MATNATVQTPEGVDPMHAEPVGHGNSVAAWATVGVMMVGSVIACLGFALTLIPVLAVGVALIPVGLVLGGVLKKAGYGVGGSKSKNNGH